MLLQKTVYENISREKGSEEGMKQKRDGIKCESEKVSEYEEG